MLGDEQGTDTCALSFLRVFWPSTFPMSAPMGTYIIGVIMGSNSTVVEDGSMFTGLALVNAVCTTRSPLGTY